MADNNGLAVGLAVGIPTFLVILLVGMFWIRNHRKQKREDLVEDDIDIGLKDDQSFQQFEQELHRPINQVTDSNGSSTLTESSQRQAHLNQNFRNQKTYDYYNTFIPVMNDGNHVRTHLMPLNDSFATKHDESFNESGVNSSLASLLMHQNNGSISTYNYNHSQNQYSNPQTPNGKNLGNLAKHLSTPQFFEKLPSQTRTYQIKKSSIVPTNNNSSSDILQNQFIGEDNKLNDSYAFTAPPVQVVDTKANSVIEDIKASSDIEIEHEVRYSNEFVSLPPSPKLEHAESIRSYNSSPFEDKPQRLI